MISKEEVFERVITLLKSICNKDDIKETDELIYDLGISSVDVLVLSTNIEEEFHVEIDENAFVNISTVSNLCNVLFEEINSKNE